MPSFDNSNLRFFYRDEGNGLPFVFQHGLGGDLSQPFSVYRPVPRIRLLGFDMRGHGRTHPLGDPNTLSIATLAEDLIAFLEHLAIDRAVVGGISLGSAVAVNVALRFPDRVLGLVLSRPAWIDGPLSANVHLYGTIARLIRDLGAEQGLARFRETPEFQAMDRESPDCTARWSVSSSSRELKNVSRGWSDYPAIRLVLLETTIARSALARSFWAIARTRSIPGPSRRPSPSSSPRPSSARSPRNRSASRTILLT